MFEFVGRLLGCIDGEEFLIKRDAVFECDLVSVERFDFFDCWVVLVDNFVPVYERDRPVLEDALVLVCERDNPLVFLNWDNLLGTFTLPTCINAPLF